NYSIMNTIALEHIIETFSEVYSDNNNSIINLEAFAKVYMNNNIVELVHTFENYIDNSILEPEHTFATFAKACATIEQYVAQTKAVIIISKMTKNSDNSDYRQALFACEKQGKYCRTNDVYKTNTVVRKFDKDDLGLIERLHDNRLRTKDIFSILASAYRSAFSEFTIARNVLIVDATYKMNRISMPLVVICSIDRFGSTYPLAFALVYFETKNYYSWVMQQLNKALTMLTGNAQVATFITDREIALIIAISEEFPQARHQLCTWHIFKNIRNKLKKLVNIDEFIKAIQKLTYDDSLETHHIEQEIIALWRQFLEAKSYMCEIWMLYKNSWLAPYTKHNINLDLKSSQRVESLHSKLKGIENRITPIDRKITKACICYIFTSKHVNDDANSELEELRLVYSQFAFELFVKQQGVLAKSGAYKVYESSSGTYNVIQTDDKA
ncbi:9419_t:CDS:2, partial [Dentiscutata heterogama]